MLNLSLAPGDYFLIGENVVVQFDNVVKNRCHLSITAPREVKILRGSLLEKGGGKRPDCVYETKAYRRELPWNHNKARSLKLIRKTLDEMEDSAQVQLLKRQLDQIFTIAPPRELSPEEQEGAD